MWTVPPASRVHCPKCGTSLRNETNFYPRIVTCKKCERIKERLKCPRESCKVQLSVCLHCEPPDIFEGQQKRNNTSLPTATYVAKNDGDFVSWRSCSPIAICGLSVLVIALLMCLKGSSESVEDMNIKLIKRLKKDFPSQRNETWYHVLSVLEKGVPSVKSITFLHGEDNRTPICLTEKLVFLYSGNDSIKSEDITFSAGEYEAMDYGFALEHYRLVLETHRVFVTDLVKVPGNIARIFHSLCDEVSSDIRPSLFIFTLKFDERTEKLKPLKRAETILKETWSDLPENEIFPLITRILKNVVDVVPEKESACD